MLLRTTSWFDTDDNSLVKVYTISTPVFWKFKAASRYAASTRNGTYFGYTWECTNPYKSRWCRLSVRFFRYEKL